MSEHLCVKHVGRMQDEYNESSVEDSITNKTEQYLHPHNKSREWIIEGVETLCSNKKKESNKCNTKKKIIVYSL